jgi:hypothetical protein
VHGITQCVFNASDGQLPIVKAEGRHGVHGCIYRLRVADGALGIDQ